MFDINDLRSLSGSRANRSSESLGLGAEYADESWKKTYKKIVNSGESVAFHIMAAESAFGYDVVLQFSIENLVHNLSIESAVIDIIEPLKKSSSTEANNIYYKLVERMSLEAKGEGFGSKVKDAAGRVWTAIKEAFKKLRLAFTHLIAGIKRFLTVAANSKDAKDLYDQSQKIMSAVKDQTVARKTIKVLAYSKTQLINCRKEFRLEQTVNFASQALNQIQQELNRELGGRGMNTSDIRAQITRYKAQWDSLIENAFRRGGIDGFKGLLTGKSDLTVKKALYGNKPSVKEVQIGPILQNYGLTLLAPNAVNSMKAAMAQVDRNVKNINDTIAAIEKIEKGMKHNEANDVKRANLEQLQLLRTVVSKVGQVLKDTIAETFRVRGVVIKAAKAALSKSSKTEGDYQKDQKNADKTAKNAVRDQFRNNSSSSNSTSVTTV